MAKDPIWVYPEDKWVAEILQNNPAKSVEKAISRTESRRKGVARKEREMFWRQRGWDIWLCRKRDVFSFLGKTAVKSAKELGILDCYRRNLI